VLKDTGSFVIDLGGSYEKGKPVRSLYNFRVLIEFCDRLAYRFAEDFYWFNPVKFPSPIEWVNPGAPGRAKDSVNPGAPRVFERRLAESGCDPRADPIFGPDEETAGRPRLLLPTRPPPIRPRHFNSRGFGNGNPARQ
jgi:hypothetical protein